MNYPIFLQQTVNQVAQMVGDSIVSNVQQPPVIEELSIMKLIFNPTSLWIMLPLIIMLALATYIFIERWLTISNASKIEPNFMNNIRDFIHNGKIESALALCRGNSTPLARMIEKGLTRIGRPLVDVSAAIENTGKLEVSRLEKGVSHLATMAGVGPSLGFLGTVVGMVVAFHNMEANPNNLNIQILAAGIYTAMITTVGGLIVGIIAYVMYNTLSARITRAINMLETKSTEFLDLLHEPV
jgi:biopolymer transport protein ExbB